MPRPRAINGRQAAGMELPFDPEAAAAAEFAAAPTRLGSRFNTRPRPRREKMVGSGQTGDLKVQMEYRWTTTTRLKKKAAPYFGLMKKKKKSFELFSVEVILKIFKFFFILDQSQICISNGLGARALQRKALFW